MFSKTTTELSISREKASANPPRIMALSELLPMSSAIIAAKADNGMERKTAMVARGLPRKIRIIKPVKPNPMAPSWRRVLMAVRT